MSKKEITNFIDVNEAMQIASATRPTIILWCREMRIGFKVGGRWKVNKKKLMEVLAGEINYGKSK